MSLYTRFPNENLPSFITSNTRERVPVFSREEACELLIRTIYDVRRQNHLQLLAFAVMPDHFHAILAVGADSLGRIVQLIKGRFAHDYNEALDTSGAVWQSRYHERTLPSEAALMSAIEYVHHNPVAARLVGNAEDYPWCTANEEYETDLAAYLGLDPHGTGQAEA